VCIQFLEHGYDFFALDLRKCGRSIISPEQDQYRHYFTDIHEYDEEITLSIEHILKEANGKTKKLIFYGHSTGGLIASLYTASGPRHQDIDALILNSPYLTALDTSFTESMLESVVMKLSLSVDIPDNWYNRSIHSSHKGEWNFDIKKKPVDKIRVHGPSFYAIRLAQQDLMKKGSCISCPILLMCSHRSIRPDKIWRDEYDEADLLLNVTTMRRAASTMGPHVTICEIENGRHDLFLSKPSVLEKTFTTMFQWLKNVEDKWLIST
jgi:alpha-beta hydrolase superfamily lysophospholipase